MGSACCVARKNEHLTSGTTREVLLRNAIYSPSWSFRWDNRRRVAGEIENISYGLSPGFSRDSSMEIKGELSLERGSYSSGRSPLRNFRFTMSPKSPIHEGLEGNLEASSDTTNTNNHGNIEEKSFKGSIGGVVVDPCEQKLFPMNTNPSSSSSYPPMSDPTTSETQPRKASRSPGHQLSRQISDNRILDRKSPPASEGRPSLVLSSCNSDLIGGGSSEGWSMRTFSELVASSRRERWSFDSECRVSESSSTCSRSPSSTDVRNCGICLKHLNEKSLWSGQKMVANSDLSVVAVLGCGHVYHAECLEAMTQEGGEECDPLCPICVFGSKQLVKMTRKIARAEAEMKSRSKISKRRVRDSFDPGYDVLDRRKSVEGGGKLLFGNKMESTSRGSSSTGGRRSFSRPFLRRHFSFGSKWNRSMLENSDNSGGRRSFWSRFH
ncbi:uncharacterized protein LOC124931430 [Impatiens glandulifera]|uniref:uncharacterized protein LOC124931430 n=1 Tax=Impatiens glandulifera TaxID=253017 RepID=UPI001FB10FCA|nr:uncharacterized protein LOC124931430 [Impatiens glandulifera]